MELQTPQPSTRAADDPARASYEAVPYSVNAFAQTQPDRLATIGRLFGLAAPDPDRCRVLELGAASGGNVIPMALGSPTSHFVGIDLSGAQVADGVRVIRELGLKNVELREMSILDVTPEFGQFDYILAHGVYSWVPTAVQEKILSICSRNLSPRGVAYVSYNCYPGWHARAALREMLWYHTARFSEPAERVRQARALLAFLAVAMPRADASYTTLIRQELMLLMVTPDSYLLHEHLDEVNEPLYFHQFAQRAAKHELQYLGEAIVGTMSPAKFGPAVEKTLQQIAPDLLQMEQYMDFLRNRMFRQTLLCHEDAKLDHALRPEALRDLYIASSAKPVKEEDEADSTREFETPAKQKLATRDPMMKSAMLRLAEAWPASVAFKELAGSADDEQRRQLATRLINCVVSQIVEFSLTPSKFVVDVSQNPTASPYARLRARGGGKVTSMRLENVQMSDLQRKILAELDGTKAAAELVGLVEKDEAEIQQMLGSFARSALLIG